MANLLVLIELVGDRPHPGSLEALGQARRIGSTLGATVYALAPCAHAPSWGEDDLIAVLSRHGADKVLLSTADAFAAPARWGTHGPTVAAACGALPPTLLLACATDGAHDLAPRLAAHLGAVYLADAWLEIDGEGLALFDGSGDGARRLEGELDFPVVAEIPAGRYTVATGDDEAEVEMFEAAPVAKTDFQEIGRRAASPAAVVLGAAAVPLAAAVGGVTDPEAQVPLAIGLLDQAAGAATCAALAGARAGGRVAVGVEASKCAAARYAVDGDPEQLASDLASALTPAAATPPTESAS